MGKEQVRFNGIYEGLQFDQYISVDAISSHDVLPLLKSPAHFLANRENERVQSPAMLLGSIVDCLLFEPVEFESRYQVLPEMYVNSKKQWVEWSNYSKHCKMVVENIKKSGKTPISEQLLDTANRIVSNITEHNAARELLKDVKTQVSIFWEDSETGVKMKGRPDAIMQSGEKISIVDLKTTADASLQTFSRTMLKFGYHIQGAVYSDGLCALNGGVQLPVQIIAAETVAPYGVAVYEIGEKSLAIGRMQYREALKRYKSARENGNFHCYSQFSEDIEIPQYAIDRVELEGVYNV